MTKKDVKDSLGAAWGRGVCPQSDPRRQKWRKSPRPLVPGKVKIMKNIRHGSRRPSRVPDRRYEAAEACLRQM